MSEQTRINWIDEETQVPLINEYARQLDSYVETFADGRVDEAELEAQGKRVTELMKEIEPQLDDALHGRVTRLLCELMAYDVMQCFFELQQARPKTAFQG